MLVEVCLQRGKRSLQRLGLDPRVRNLGAVIAWGGGGFLLSAGSVAGFPQPIVMGFVCAATGWTGLVMTLGAMCGYPFFWGSEGAIGVVWTAAAGLLAAMVGRLRASREQPLMIPTITAFLEALTEVCFLLMLRVRTPPMIMAGRVVLSFLAGVLFTQTLHCRETVCDWLTGGMLVLGLAPAALGPVGFGYLAAGVLGVTAPFPAAALAGLGLDLAQVTKVPMTAVLCLGWVLRLAPWEQKWQSYASPGIAYLIFSAACGIWDTAPLPGLVLGSALGAVLPPQPQVTRRRGQSGAAQVRLELGAAVMGNIQQIIAQLEPPPIDEFALLEKARHRACTRCAMRKNCQEPENFTTLLLEDPLDADCPRAGRLIPELQRSQEQLRLLKADRQRRREYRGALLQQYRFLGDYLRHLADTLPRGAQGLKPQFRIEASARSQGKERANGDQCLAFPGMENVFYVLLCDGMGTGLGAAQEGRSGADLLRRLLTAGFPAEHALETLNSLLALSGKAGAVTVDLAEVHLDSGIARIYKWGACPSWVLRRSGAEKIGTATPPPGLRVGETRMAVEKLSLRRGEVLVLLSDGVGGEVAQVLSGLTLDAPPGELAAQILQGAGGQGEDDATAAAIRLRPLSLAPS